MSTIHDGFLGIQEKLTASIEDAAASEVWYPVSDEFLWGVRDAVWALSTNSANWGLGDLQNWSYKTKTRKIRKRH